MGLIIGVVLILLAFHSTVICDIFPECDGVESQTFIADYNDCESYIYCDDEESFASKCSNGERFNEELGICDDAGNVECNVEETLTSTDKSTTKEEPTTREEVTSTESPSPSSTTTSTTSLSSTKSNPTSSSTLVPSSSLSTTETATTNVICPTPSRAEDIVYLPNSESCSEYYMCYNKIAIPMTCPRDLEFNRLTSSCDWAYSANCKVIGTTTPSPRELCTGNKSGYFEYVKNCHYYYRCMNGLLTIQECPSGFGWDGIRKMCSSTACRRKV
ncbi:probable endochitinase [Eupeodes corollae]|uniref:probable endochitinase n=1 Tax=Eupeodes corollae TaxID=290404 RepID=UPI002493AFED|nr:probable endochitinase [Eupeodes corollae]